MPLTPPLTQTLAVNPPPPQSAPFTNTTRTDILTHTIHSLLRKSTSLTHPYTQACLCMHSLTFSLSLSLPHTHTHTHTHTHAQHIEKHNSSPYSLPPTSPHLEHACTLYAVRRAACGKPEDGPLGFNYLPTNPNYLWSSFH